MYDIIWQRVCVYVQESVAVNHIHMYIVFMGSNIYMNSMSTQLGASLYSDQPLEVRIPALEKKVRFAVPCPK